MANTGGDQAIWVTEGFEEEVVKTYRQIKDLIQKSTSISFEKAIQEIAGVSKGTWYNYISKGKQRGRVSKYTVKKLAEFSGLSERIFSGAQEFIEDDKKIFEKSVKEKLNNNLSKNIVSILDGDILENLKELSKQIDSITEIDTIDKLKMLLDNMSKRAELKKETLLLDKEIFDN